MKKYLIVIIIILACFSCKKKKMSFVQLNQFDNIDTLHLHNKAYINKQIHYIINNYNNDEKGIKLIDSFAVSVASKQSSVFSNFTIIFYKASDITNLSHLQKNPRDIDRYSQKNDMLFDYQWTNGKFTGKTYFERY